MTKIVKILSCILFFSFFACLEAHAQTTISATSCSESDVSSALGKVSSGSVTVTIPKGTCGWTSQLKYTVPSGVTSLTIQGATVVACTGTAGTSSYACTATDNTVLVDSYSASNQPILNINVGAAATVFRLTGISFHGGTLSGGVTKPNGFITFSGSSQHFRVDHCDFNTNTYNVSNSGGGVTLFSPITGVFDHDTFELSGQNNGVRDYAGIGDFGDKLWSEPTNFGGSDWLFVESSVFQGGAANDCGDGAKMVLRYNTIEANPSSGDTGLWQGHQMGQGQQRDRGCRALQIYHNYIYNPNPSNNQYADGDGGSGTGLVYDNTISSGYSYDIIFQNIREKGTGHIQTAPPNGIGYCGSNSSGVTSAWDGNSVATTGYPCIDQTGRGQSDLLNGQDFPNAVNTATGSISWPHNLREPWYVWGESIASGKIYNAPAWNNVPMVENRDFYISTSSFNGTSGVGVGTLSSRPSTCTPGPGGTYGTSPTGSYGVAYFATDANKGRGELYVCTSTNTWTPVYEPDIYPYPLVSGGAPDPPSSLSAAAH